jgi:hypothetical protein
MLMKLADRLELPLEAVIAAESRLWRKVRRGAADECWPWQASCCSSGYGQIYIKGRLRIATRVIFLLTHGYLPAVVMHKCDNPPCCNPAHLLPGTKATNNADKMRKGHFRRMCGDDNGARRHPERLSRGDHHYARTRPELLANRGEKHHSTHLDLEKVNTIRSRFSNGEATKTQLSREYAVSQSTIGRILNREVWK